jgi:hypothetical protein
VYFARLPVKQKEFFLNHYSEKIRTPPQFSLFTLSTENITINSVISPIIERRLREVHLFPNSFIPVQMKRFDVKTLHLHRKKHITLLQSPETRRELKLKEEK